MGSIVPTLTNVALSQGAGLIASEFSRQKSRGSQDNALQNLRTQQQLQEAQLSATSALNRDKITLDAKAAASERTAALRRSVSRQRARFGAQGTGSSGGSSQAVLLGLFEESEDEKRVRDGLDNLKLNAIDQDLANRKSLNVLQRSQLEERNKIARVSAGGNLFSGLFGF